MKAQKAVFNWSGGKDSSLCLFKTLAARNYEIACLLTTVNGYYQRVSMHGVRHELLERQAASVGIPLLPVVLPEKPSMQEYDSIMETTLKRLRQEDVTVSIFGDIFLEDLRTYREQRLARLKMKALFPLWQIPTRQLLQEFIDSGFKGVIVCVNERHLDKSFAGREIDEDFVKDLPPGVDSCGEYGEFHSFVYDGPLFKTPILFDKGEVVHRRYEMSSRQSQDSTICVGDSSENGFWYCDLIPKS